MAYRVSSYDLIHCLIRSDLKYAYLQDTINEWRIGLAAMSESSVNLHQISILFMYDSL